MLQPLSRLSLSLRPLVKLPQHGNHFSKVRLNQIAESFALQPLNGQVHAKQLSKMVRHSCQTSGLQTKKEKASANLVANQ